MSFLYWFLCAIGFVIGAFVAACIGIFLAPLLDRIIDACDDAGERMFGRFR